MTLALLFFRGGGGTAPVAPTTTDYCDLRDDIIARLEQLTPTKLVQWPFRHVPKRYMAEELAARTGSASLRRFDFQRRDLVDPPFFDEERLERNELVVLTVTYPALPGLYGLKDYDDLETVMRADARQIRDLLTKPVGFATGQVASLVRTMVPETTGHVWLQRFEVLLIYREDQTLV